MEETNGHGPDHGNLSPDPIKLDEVATRLLAKDLKELRLRRSSKGANTWSGWPG